MKGRFEKRIRKAGLVIFGLWLAIGLAGPAAVCAAPEVTDLSISDAVEDQLRLDHAFASDLVDVTTQDGVVTLSGSVDNILAKERAARIAAKVKGVRAVVNTIAVVPPILRSDSEIEDDVKAALRLDPAAESYEVDVDVQDNVVTLTGRVDSWQERTLSEKVAKGVQGVTGLENKIDVLYKVDRPDAEIEAEIEQALRWDVLVDHALIEVDVINGRVVLSGIVGSLAEKGRATADAYVANVQGVDAEGLEVRRWARDDDLRGDKYKDLTDGDIRAAVEDALFYDPRVAAFNVTPEVTNGVVTLRGTVDNLKAKKAAARTARNTVGVLQVANRLKVRPETPVEAPALEDRIRATFERDPVVEATEITIDVQNGVAELFGSVDTAFERSWAEDLAARVDGVIAVRNYLAVTGYFDPYLYDPYLDDWYAGDAPDYYDPPVTMKSDDTIREEIEEEFFWSPFVDGGDIDIEVDNGRATLTGHVDSWSEYSAASDNAFEGGAVVVYNQLEVR